MFCFFFFQAEDGIRDAQESRGLGDVYKRQGSGRNAIKLKLSDKYEKAIDILISLEDKKPIGFSKADLYNYLGFATRKKNNPNYEDAEEYYLSALSIDANHIGALEYLGELYFETDRLGQAKELLIKLGAVAGENSVEYKELFDLLN